MEPNPPKKEKKSRNFEGQGAEAQLLNFPTDTAVHP